MPLAANLCGLGFQAWEPILLDQRNFGLAARLSVYSAACGQFEPACAVAEGIGPVPGLRQDAFIFSLTRCLLRGVQARTLGKQCHDASLTGVLEMGHTKWRK